MIEKTPRTRPQGFLPMPEPYSDEFNIPVLDTAESPLHGYRGIQEAASRVPAGLSIAITREAGSRGATIAQHAGTKLGWELYSQEMLEYGAQNAAVRQELLDKLPPDAAAWIDRRLQHLLQDASLSRQPDIIELARLVLTLAAHGNVILLGRGAGFILPSRSTLHVRLVAPLHDRVAYLSQWLRLTDEEAAELVRKRDHQRTDFLATHFHRKPNDVHVYDMVLNTSLLGEERCADLIAAAARAKMSAIVGMD
jgi:cytidylate kinase